MKARQWGFILALVVGLAALAASGLGSSNGNGDILAELTVSAGGGISTQPNGYTLAFTIGFVASPQEPVVANASGAMLAMGFQAFLQAPAPTATEDWPLYE